MTDIQIVTATGTGICILLLQILNLWRSLANARGIRHTNREVAGVVDVNKQINDQLTVIATATKNVQSLLRGQPGKPYGRRSTDVMPPADPPSDMKPARQVWPLGGDVT